MTQESAHFLIAEPDDFYRVDTHEGRQELLEWLERRLSQGHEYIEMLPSGFALFRKVTPNARSEPTARLFAQVGSTDWLCHTGEK